MAYERGERNPRTYADLYDFMSTQKRAQLSVRLGIFFLVVVVAVIGVMLWWADGQSAVNPEETALESFVIPAGEPIRSIASRLYEEDLIRSPTVFFMLVKLKGLDQEIQAGEFRLSQAMRASEVAEELTHGIVDQWVTTLEGWRVDEVATVLAKELDIPEQEFLKVAREGYMFPDTYLIPRTASAAAVAELFEETFAKKISPQLRSDVSGVGLTFEEVMILASIVEREGNSDQDRPMIAGVLLNRLRNDWPLQADATVQYALGYQPQEKSWWKRHLTFDDLEIASPYNTYQNMGLPPTPISNPGISSIEAVVYPADTDYMYYLHDPQGGVHFARTLDEHNENIQRYLQ